MGAVLSCGNGGVLSHASAAVLWDLLRPLGGPAHVSLPSRSGRSRRDDLILHRSRSLEPSDCTRRHFIPVTTPTRTLNDLAATSFEPRLLRRAIREAELRGYRVDPRARAKTRRSRSDLELDFLDFCHRHRIPPPEVNVRVGRFTVDFLWREARLVVETDAYGTHGGEVAFEDDRARDLALRAAGLRVSRLTGRLLDAAAERVAADLRRQLGLPAGRR